MAATLATPNSRCSIRHGIDTTDLERIPDGKTFRWYGRYDYDLNVAHTLDTQLNVFADFKPKLSDESQKLRLVFLGNIQPDLQREVREQVPNAELVALDTMNLWIDITKDSLVRTIRGVDVVIINDAEARQLTSIPNVIKAARTILSWGPKALIVKRGEYGAALFTPIVTSLFPLIHWSLYLIRLAPAILLRAALWVICRARKTSMRRQ